ncbi:alpha/beta fold hydrolase [Umezawaea beigongshangensis]|uniref:alpha/beta fold hydrolase n=1 Tax=Umezawaea beigongshangensis TaxID=2780383 RepID=UPI0018F1114A|nr:alpha/beta hydrolase [Umezawaea beigongshangensis]
MTTARGVGLSLREAGGGDGPPLVLLHGWAQSGEVWAPLLGDPALTGRHRVVAPDLRGHGESDVPADGYDDPAAWADDVDAVLDHVGVPAVLVGWSYGGLVITDLLRERGADRVAGLVLVGAITEIGRGRPGGEIGDVMRAALPDALADDPGVAVPALSRFCAAVSPGLPGEVVQRWLGTALRVPPHVRGALFRRDVDSSAVLKGLDVPTLVVHGDSDRVVAPGAAEHAAAQIPGAVLSRYAGTGHAPFAEHPERFAAELAAFAGALA